VAPLFQTAHSFEFVFVRVGIAGVTRRKIRLKVLKKTFCLGIKKNSHYLCPT